MRTELKRLHHETGATFIYVTHDQLEAMTLATKICLMKNGLLQQYQSPLTIYNKPANTFVADFVGNPSINLVPFQAKKTSDVSLELANPSLSFLFETDNKLPDGLDGPVTLGIRPEFITLQGNHAIKATVHSSLPSGMETILRLEIGNLLLNSVVFGSLDFSVGSSIDANFSGKGFMLFDKNGTFVDNGTLSPMVK